MNYELEKAKYNSRVRMLFFFARPLHIFFILLFAKMWKLMSYGPSHIDNFFLGHKATEAVQGLWLYEFRPFIGYFILAVLIDLALEEFLPLLRNR